MSEKTHNYQTAQSVSVDKISGAAWNTHRSKKEDEALAGLIENIRHNGMIHRIAVRTLTYGKFEIIDGHRRFEAAKTLGWTTVPCEVYEGMSDEEAQERTLSANLQRLANDPILEAECIRKLADADKTYEQIAACLGKDARYIARRARLCNLTEKWRNWFGKMDAEADTMEMVAKHEAKLQDEVFGALEIADGEGEVDADDIELAFKRRLRRLDEETGFDIEDAGCMNCPYNTATHGYLFQAEEDEDCAGRCENAECYVRNWNAATDALIEDLRKKKVEIKEARQKWDIPNYWEATGSRSKKRTEPWVYTENGLKSLVWAEPKASPICTAPAQTEEEKAAAKRVKKAHNAWTKNRRAAYDKIRKGIDCDEGKARTMADLVVSTTVFTKRMTDEITHKLTFSYACDCDCQTWLESLTDEDLAQIGIEALTAEEREAISTKDPAESDNGEEA